jgi:hypothetical protein
LIVGAAILGGSAALGIAVVRLFAFATARVDQLVISHRGVKYGDRFWRWEAVRAIRARRSRLSGAIQLLLWAREGKGMGQTFVIDERITPERAIRLMERLGAFCLANNLEVLSEASLDPP